MAQLQIQVRHNSHSWIWDRQTDVSIFLLVFHRSIFHGEARTQTIKMMQRDFWMFFFFFLANKTTVIVKNWIVSDRDVSNGRNRFQYLQAQGIICIYRSLFTTFSVYVKDSDKLKRNVCCLGFIANGSVPMKCLFFFKTNQKENENKKK